MSERDQKRRKLQMLMSEKRLLGRVSHLRSYESNRQKLNTMLNHLEFKQPTGHKVVIDISNIIGALDKKEEETPHDEDEDEAWRSLYEGIRFLDDMNGYKELDKDQVIAARRLEIEYFRKMGVYKKVKREEAQRLGIKVITTKWLDTNKGDDKNPKLP